MMTMTFRKLRIALSALALVAAACAPLQGDDPGPDSGATPGRAQAGQTLYPKPGVAPGKRFPLAVGLLERGEFDQARVELVAHLQDVPNSRRAKLLISQIDADARVMFGDQSFSYRLGVGDSLSSVARTFLSDPLLFVALAKYNDIRVPGRVTVGQTIQVPGVKPPAVEEPSTAESPTQPEPETRTADAPPSEPEATGEDTDPVMTDRSLSESLEAEDSQNLALILPPPSEQLSLDDALTLASDQLSDSAYDEAYSTLRRARSLYPDSVPVEDLYIRALDQYSAELADSDKFQASALKLEAAQLRLDQGDEQAAMTSFLTAADYDPGNSLARNEGNRLRTKICDSLYQEGLEALHGQDLDAAIANWEQVLAYDPNYSDAKLQLARARDMKERFEALRGQP